MGAFIARLKRWSIPGLALLLAVPALASTSWSYALDASASDVSARVAFMGMSSKTARFPTLTGNFTLVPGQPDAIELNVALDARALRASDGQTLDRLKGPSFFDVANYPSIRFSGRSMRMTSPRTADVSGELTARGITRPQVLKVTFERAPQTMAGSEPMGLVGTMAIDRRHYGMTSWSGIVGNKVDITIRTRMLPN